MVNSLQPDIMWRIKTTSDKIREHNVKKRFARTAKTWNRDNKSIGGLAVSMQKLLAATDKESTSLSHDDVVVERQWIY